MTDKIHDLQEKLFSLTTQKNELQAQIKPLQVQLSSVFKEIQSLTEKISEEKLNTNLSEQEFFDFVMFEDGSSIDQVRYNKASSYIQELGLFMSGYSPFSKQKKSHVIFFENDIEKNSKSIIALKKLSSLYKPMNEDGDIIFPVLCKDFNIVFNQKWFIQIPNYKYEFDSLEDLFSYFISNFDCHDSQEDQSDDD